MSTTTNACKVCSKLCDENHHHCPSNASDDRDCRPSFVLSMQVCLQLWAFLQQAVIAAFLSLQTKAQCEPRNKSLIRIVLPTGSFNAVSLWRSPTHAACTSLESSFLNTSCAWLFFWLSTPAHEPGNTITPSVDWPSHMCLNSCWRLLLMSHSGRPLFLDSRPWSAAYSSCSRVIDMREVFFKCFDPGAVSPDQEASQVAFQFEAVWPTAWPSNKPLKSMYCNQCWSLSSTPTSIWPAQALLRECFPWAPIDSQLGWPPSGGNCVKMSLM